MDKQKMPVLDIVGDAYSYFFEHFGAFVRASLLWVLILVGGIYGSVAAIRWSVQNAPEVARFIASLRPETVGVAFGIVFGLLTMLALSAIAVSWHRSIIKRAPAPLLVALPGAATFRYIGYVLWIFLVVALPIVFIAAVGYLVAQIGGTADIGSKLVKAGLALGAVVLVFAIAVSAGRFALALPATAIGERMTIWQSWDRTTGNTWRIFWGNFLAALAPAILSGLVNAVADKMEPLSTGYYVAFAVSTSVSAAQTVLVAGFLSFSYVHFTRKPSEPATNEKGDPAAALPEPQPA